MTYYRLRYRYRRPMSTGRQAGLAAAAAVLALGAGHVVTHHHGHIGAAPSGWARSFLAAAGDPRTSCDLGAVIAWQHAEGSNPAWRNPLDSTEPEPGSTPVNSDGVQAYTSRRQGLAATITTLGNGRYSAIIAALSAGDDAQSVADAVSDSPWGTEPFGASC
jgi:hypothetical protein